MPSRDMALFKRKRSDDDDFEPLGETMAPGIGSVKDFDPALFDDPAALRQFILARLYLESQTAPTAGMRIAALKEMANLQLVSEEVKFRVQNKGDTIVNIVSVSNMLNSARDRTRREAEALELPPNTSGAEKPQTPF